MQCIPSVFQINFPLCTIAHTPRLPEHCIEYVRILLWPKEEPFGGEFYFDSPPNNNNMNKWTRRKYYLHSILYPFTILWIIIDLILLIELSNCWCYLYICWQMWKTYLSLLVTNLFSANDWLEFNYEVNFLGFFWISYSHLMKKVDHAWWRHTQWTQLSANLWKWRIKNIKETHFSTLNS